MRAGKLDRRIRIERKETSTDSMGGITESYRELATVSAELVPQSARERFLADVERSERMVMFRIRYRRDVKATMRIAYRNQLYDITGVQEIGRRDGLEIMCVGVE